MKRKISKRAVALLVCLVLALTAAVGGTLAHVFTKTDPVENTFTPAQVSCAVVETFENNVKEDVRIQNTGDADAYIRVAVVVTFKNENGNVYARTPDPSTDYTITYLDDTGWLEGSDGFWYYRYPVACTDDAGTAANETLTGILIDTAKLLDGAAVPEGYALSVEIVASAIQASPAKVAEQQWGVSVGSDGTVTAAP